MFVKMVYPDMTADEYVATVGSLNEDISIRNNILLLPRILWLGFKAICYLICLPVLFLLWRTVLFVITARGMYVIVMGLFIAIALSPLPFYGVKRMLDALLRVLSDRFSFFSAMDETFTFSPYTERTENMKQVNKRLRYYNMCDTLRRNGVRDVSLDCSESPDDGCLVTISYSAAPDVDKIRLIKLKMSFKTSPGIDTPVVDLDRMSVLFPKK